MYAQDAVDDRGGVATIANEYERLFRLTRSRRLRMGPLTWNTQDGRIIATKVRSMRTFADAAMHTRAIFAAVSC